MINGFAMPSEARLDHSIIPALNNSRKYQKLATIIDELYNQALSNNPNWSQALKRLGNLFGANGVLFAGSTFENNFFSLDFVGIEGLAFSDLPKIVEKDFAAETWGKVPIDPNKCVSSDIHWPKSRLQQRIDAKLVPAKHARFVSILHVQPPYWDTLSVCRSIDDKPFTLEDCALLDLFRFDVRRIMALLHIKKKINDKAKDIANIVNILNSPAGIVRGNGELIVWNDAANATFGARDSEFENHPDWQTAARTAANTGYAKIDYGEFCIKFKALDFDKKADEENPNSFSIYYSQTAILAIFENNVTKSQDIKLIAKPEWKLSTTEQKLLELFLEGLSVKQIAQRRSKSPGTIKAQIRSIFGKAGVKSRVELVAALYEA